MNDIKVGDIWYRFESEIRVSMDEYDHSNYANIKERQFVVVKTTKCGAWIVEKKNESNVFLSEYVDQRQRFVMSSNIKSYAYPTIERAKSSFLFRKRKQISILKSKLDLAQQAFEKAKSDWNMKDFSVIRPKTLLPSF